MSPWRAAMLLPVLLLAWQAFAAAAAAPASGTAAAPDVRRRGAEVYAVQCAVCHGVDGDGAGMAAHMFRAQPRDFRRGLFKFRSTPSGSLPTDADLLRTVTDGIRWTAMVGRPDLPEADRWAAIQHVKTFFPGFAAAPPPQRVAPSPAPPATSALLEQGARLYRDAECGRCHGERGRGDGPSAAGLKDDRGWPAWATDFTWRPLKRGSSPESLYLTIATGLAGTPMPSYGDALEPEQVWALVAYLDSLVLPEHRVSPARPLGEEARGWMALRMGGTMGRGMMHRMPMMR